MMQNGMKWFARLAGTAVVGLAMAACGDSTGPAGTGQMSVSLQESSGSSALMTSLSPAESSSNEISTGSVSSVEITLERVEALAAGQPVGQPEEGAWVSLEVEGEVTVDLMDLAASGPITLAEGTVQAGSFLMVRLFFSEASITTEEEIELEGGGTVPPGTYDLFIPSGMQTGVKIPLGNFVVREDGNAEVVLEIDTEGSVQTVVWTESMGFIMNSVLIQVGQ